MTIPVVVVVGLLLGHLSEHPAASPSSPAALPAVTMAAPPSSAGVDVPCTKVFSGLPVTLSGLSGRPARSTWTYVAAWGNPAIELTCGVPRPAALTPGSSALVIEVDGVNWLPVQQRSLTVWTAIDRAVYVQVLVPSSYAQPPLAPISDAIAANLPQVCQVGPTVPVSKLCTRRP